MQYFNIPTVPEISPARKIAREILIEAETELQRWPAHYAKIHGMFWSSPVPPAEIAAELGAEGVKFLTVSETSKAIIDDLLTITGADRDEVFPPEVWAPRLPLTPNADGSVTVGTVDGLDAWGRATPPEPKQQAEPLEI